MTSKKELAILAHLRKNGRIKLTELSKYLNIPQTTTFDAFRRVNNRYVKKHTALIDFDKLYYGIRIFFFVKINKDERDEFDNYLEKESSINTILKHSDGYLLECIFSSIREMHDFKERLISFPNAKVEYHEILEEISRESFLSDPDALDYFLEIQS